MESLKGSSCLFFVIFCYVSSLERSVLERVYVLHLQKLKSLEKEYIHLPHILSLLVWYNSTCVYGLDLPVCVNIVVHYVVERKYHGGKKSFKVVDPLQAKKPRSLTVGGVVCVQASMHAWNEGTPRQQIRVKRLWNSLHLD